MFKSIRWTLQLWHALLLLLVVCIFCGTLYFRLRVARYQSVDSELQGAAETLAARVFPAFPKRPETRPFERGGGRPPWMRDGRRDEPSPNGPDGPPRRMRGAETRPSNELGRGPDDGSFRGRGPETRPFGQVAGSPEPPPRREGPRRGPPDHAFMEEMQRRLEVPEFLLQRFEGEGAQGFYYAIFHDSGELLKTSLEDEIPAVEPRPIAPAPFAPYYRQRDHVREIVVAGPWGAQVLVGRSIRKEEAELRHIIVLLAITGVGVMVVGLLGGLALSNRAVRPIQTITTTAQTISASNLSRRISLAETESELGTLANVLNEMFTRLQGAFERQIRFTADASHELRTPLSIIYSHAELALNKPRSAEEYRESIETCFRAAKRMKSLVECLLVLARADAGRLEIKRDSFDLAHTAEDCAEMIRPMATDKKVELKLELQSTPVLADMFRIAQVITNLLTNAINYNREGGSVTVSVRPEGTGAILEVTDTGMGIGEEDQKHLFERFYRVDKARSREMGGSGLGLAICQTIVEAHGGTISCTSKLGEGTTFTVRLSARASG